MAGYMCSTCGGIDCVCPPPTNIVGRKNFVDPTNPPPGADMFRRPTKSQTHDTAASFVAGVRRQLAQTPPPGADMPTDLSRMSVRNLIGCCVFPESEDTLASVEEVATELERRLAELERRCSPPAPPPDAEAAWEGCPCQDCTKARTNIAARRPSAAAVAAAKRIRLHYSNRICDETGHARDCPYGTSSDHEESDVLQLADTVLRLAGETP